MKKFLSGTPVLLAVTAFLIVLVPQAARAQFCPPSYLTYVVRDAKGAAIRTARSDLRFDGGAAAHPAAWQVEKPGFRNSTGTATPADIETLLKDTESLSTSTFCHFEAPVSLRITLQGKVMDLTFLMPKAADYKHKGETADFVVDSLPFRAGKFQIQLALPADHELRSLTYYEARGWRRVR